VAEYNLRKEDREEISRVPVPVQPGNPVFVQVIHSSHVRSSKYCIVVSDSPSSRLNLWL
jgi:hypothetical protein